MRWTPRYYSGPPNNWDIGIVLVNDDNRPMRELEGVGGWKIFQNLREAVEYVRAQNLGSVEWPVTWLVDDRRL